MASRNVLDLVDSTDSSGSLSASVYMSAFCDIKTTLSTSISENIVNAKYALFEVSPVYIYRGVPVLHTDKGIIANMSGGLASGTYSRVGAPSMTDSFGSTSRWVASTSSISNDKWYPSAGSDKTSYFSSIGGGQFPAQYTTGYMYMNGTQYTTAPDGTGALQISSDTYLTMSNFNFSTGTHTFILVAIVRSYDSSPVSLIATGDSTGGLGAPSRKFASVQYRPDGMMGMYYDDSVYPASTVKVIDRGLSQSRPIVAYLNVNVPSGTVTYGVVSSSVTQRTHEMPHEYSGNIYIGGSPYSNADNYTVDVLEVLYAKQSDVSSIVDKIDYLYGVAV